MLMNLAERENETTNPVIPGAVKRRPGIHAEVLDSRFRGNDGGLHPTQPSPFTKVMRGRLPSPVSRRLPQDHCFWDNC